jgi:hypothetical protein
VPILFKLQGLHSRRGNGIAPLVGFQTLPVVLLRIYGVTRDSGGTALASCTVNLFRTSDNAFIDRVVSGADGAYEFRSGSLTTNYYVVAYKAGSPDVSGTTVNTLVAGA